MSTNTIPPQTIFAIMRPDGSLSLRTLHTKPAVALQLAEEDHTTEWTDLQAKGYRLVTLQLVVQEIHPNAFAAVQRHSLKLKAKS